MLIRRELENAFSEANKFFSVLLLTGARQVGKTYAIERFGRESYAESVTINFKETPSAAAIFPLTRGSSEKYSKFRPQRMVRWMFKAGASHSCTPKRYISSPTMSPQERAKSTSQL